MPSRLDDNSSLRFLYACLESAQPNRIDYQTVAKEFGMVRLRGSLGGQQSAKVSKAKVSAASRQKQQRKKKTGVKEGLELNWKGMPDDDDDEAEIVVGKVECRDGMTKKEESADENAGRKEETVDEDAWKFLSEASVPISSTEPQMQFQAYDGGAYSTAGQMLSSNDVYYQDPAQLEQQTSGFHAALSGSPGLENGFQSSPGEYAYSPAHVAIPSTTLYSTSSAACSADLPYSLPH